MALALVHENKRFVYSGDAGLCDELRALSRDADLLLHWCYRLDGEDVSADMAATTPTPSEIGAMAKQVGARQLILTHFRKHMDASDKHANAIGKASAHFGSPVMIAEDLQEYDI